MRPTLIVLSHFNAAGAAGLVGSAAFVATGATVAAGALVGSAFGTSVGFGAAVGATVGTGALVGGTGVAVGAGAHETTINATTTSASNANFFISSPPNQFWIFDFGFFRFSCLLFDHPLLFRCVLG
jgi:hypothetical protein